MQYIIENNKSKTILPAPEDRIPLPFTVIRHNNCTLDLESNPNFSQVVISSYEPFEIQQDYSFLDDMGIVHVDKNNLQKYIPPEYIPYKYYIFFIVFIGIYQLLMFKVNLFIIYKIHIHIYIILYIL